MLRQEHCALLFRPLEDRSFPCHGGWDCFNGTTCLTGQGVGTWSGCQSFRGKKGLRIPIGFIPFWWAIALVSKKNISGDIFVFFEIYYYTVHSTDTMATFIGGSCFSCSWTSGHPGCFLEHSPWLPPRRWMWPMPYEPW